MAEPKKPRVSTTAKKRDAERERARQILSDFVLLQGLFEEQVLGTFPVIRGFADIRYLAEISVPYAMEENENMFQRSTRVRGHQRPLDAEHAQEIKTYLESHDRRFMPEIILSLRGWWQLVNVNGKGIGVENDDLIVTTIEGEEPMPEEEQNPDDLITIDSKGHVLGNEELEMEELITIGPINPKNYDGIHRITIDRNDIEEVREHRLIRRIDGNHRLSAVDLNGPLRDEETEPSRYRVPFCLILLGPPEDEDDDFHEAQIFHTINSTALPLESEHALKLILAQDEYLFNAENEWETDPVLHLTRHLHKQLDAQSRRKPVAIGKQLGVHPVVGAHRVARLLMNWEPTLFESRVEARDFAPKFADALTIVIRNSLGPADALLRSMPFFLEFAALPLLHCWPEDKRLTDISTSDAQPLLCNFWEWARPALWIGDDWELNHAEITLRLQRNPPDAHQLWRLYQAALARVPRRLFLARWNPGDDTVSLDARRAGYRLKSIHQTIENLKVKGIYLELIDIDSQKRGTYPIALEIWNQISACDLMLIDLTGERLNVMIEAGYALSHHPHDNLIFLFHSVDGKLPPSDLSGFDIATASEIADIPSVLEPRIEAIIQNLK